MRNRFRRGRKLYSIQIVVIFFDDWKGGSEGQESKEMKVVENKVRQLLLITRAHL